jgi:hypothetical protein
MSTSFGHDGKNWWHNITIFTKLLNNIIVVLDKLHFTSIIYPLQYKLQDNSVVKSWVAKKFLNPFQINSFNHNIVFC